MNNLKPDFTIIISHIYELRMANYSLYGYLLDYEKEATELIQSVELIANLVSALFEATKKAYCSADLKIYQKLFTELQDLARKIYALADRITQTTSLSEDEDLQKAADRIKNLLTSQSSSNPIRH